MSRRGSSSHSRAMARLASKLRKAGFGSYRQYLASPHWSEVREAYRSSGLPQSCPCGEARVDLHHKTYKRLGNERLTGLVPLCRAHHRLVHEAGRTKSSVGLCVTTARVLRELGP